ncbi:MAG: M23 family metallopeptidase [Acutalibacteraceae bacterium]
MTFFICKNKINAKTAALAIALVVTILLCLFIPAFGNCDKTLTSKSDYIKWVDFGITLPVLKQAMQYDIKSYGTKNHIDWISLLAIAACKNGGNFKDKPNEVIDSYAKRIQNGENLKTITKDLNYYNYYYSSYSAVLGNFLGKKSNGEYGIIAYSPIANGYGYSHSDDFGNSRSYGFKRKHLGNDLIGSVGTPIISVEDGIVENLGWNKYGGWRVGIRSKDFKRYYYYAHLRKGHPFAPNLMEGDEVKAGDVIGYLGMTGYSDNEDYNGMTIPHLHFGMQLIFDDSQVEGNNEIWVDVYNIVRLLYQNRMSVTKVDNDYIRNDKAT